MAKQLVDKVTGEIAFVWRLPELRHAYSDHTEVSDVHGLACLDVSRTQQSFRDEADINTIVRRFGLDGKLPTDVRAPVYGDFTQVGDYQSALNAVNSAKASFMQLPARVRSEFQNDPQRFVEFCSDPANAEKMADLGLVAPEAAQRLAAEASAREVAAFEERAAKAGLKRSGGGEKGGEKSP